VISKQVTGQQGKLNVEADIPEGEKKKLLLIVYS